MLINMPSPASLFKLDSSRVRQNYTMPPAETLDDRCHGELSHGVCAERANFHIHLSMLGKTSMTDPAEIEVLQPNAKSIPRPMSNKVFLYEISQLHDTNTFRMTKYRRDLSNFLGLQEELDPFGDSHSSRNHKYALDICLPKYKTLRRKLMGIARAASTWIRMYFMQHPDVLVSSPEYFDKLLLTWMEDPCELQEPESEDEYRRRLLMWE